MTVRKVFFYIIMLGLQLAFIEGGGGVASL